MIFFSQKNQTKSQNLIYTIYGALLIFFPLKIRFSSVISLIIGRFKKTQNQNPSFDFFLNPIPEKNPFLLIQTYLYEIKNGANPNRMFQYL